MGGVVASLEPVSFTRKLVACGKEKNVGCLRAAYSNLGKLSPDDVSLPPVYCRAPHWI